MLRFLNSLFYFIPVSEEVNLNISDGVYFTLPTQLKTSKIKRAHLWVYINKPSTPLTRNFVELQVVQIAPETRSSERLVQKPIETKKINIGKKYKPWRQIDFKKVLEFWTKRPEFNFGVQIRALDGNGNNLVVLPPDEEYVSSHMLIYDQCTLISKNIQDTIKIKSRTLHFLH